jgi:hypothetical protein
MKLMITVSSIHTADISACAAPYQHSCIIGVLLLFFLSDELARLLKASHLFAAACGSLLHDEALSRCLCLCLYSLLFTCIDIPSLDIDWVADLIGGTCT